MYTTPRLNAYRLVIWAAFFPALYYLIVAHPQLLWVSLGVYCVQQLVGFNAYLHRLVSHRSYQTYKPIEGVMGVLSVLCLTGSPISWAWIHRAHHRYSETPRTRIAIATWGSGKHCSVCTTSTTPANASP